MRTFIAFFILLAIGACQNGANIKEQEQITPSSTPFFKAKMNGNLWEAPRIIALVDKNRPMVIVTGRQSENATSARQIIFVLPLEAKANDKITIIKGVDCQGLQSYASVIEDTPEKTFTNFESESGEITIKLHDKQAKLMEGSFSFSAKGSKGVMNITEGAFSLKYE